LINRPSTYITILKEEKDAQSGEIMKTEKHPEKEIVSIVTNALLSVLPELTSEMANNWSV